MTLIKEITIDGLYYYSIVFNTYNSVIHNNKIIIVYRDVILKICNLYTDWNNNYYSRPKYRHEYILIKKIDYKVDKTNIHSFVCIFFMIINK